MEFQENPLAELMTVRRDVGSQLLAQAAVEADDADVRWINRRLGVISTAERLVMIDGSVGNESVVGAKAVKDKTFAKRLFDASGLATAGGGPVASEDEAIRVARDVSFPVVVKPASAGLGKGVSVDLTTDEEVRAAYTEARAFGESVVVERYIDIEDEFRCLATPDAFISAFKRVLPFVVGDGQSTVHELVEMKNASRTSNPILRGSPIPLDNALTRTIGRQGFTLDSVLPSGLDLVVRNVNGLTSGGEPHEYTDVVDSGVKEAARRAVAAIPGMNWAGVDLAVERGTGVAYVIEVNAAASFGGSAFPLQGRPRDVAGELWRRRKAEGQSLVSADPPALQERPTPVKLMRSSPRNGAAGGKLLASIVKDDIEGRGCTLDRPTNGLMRVRIAGGEERWITGDLGSVHDLLAARRAVRKHSTVRRLLAFHSIPRIFGVTVTSSADIEPVYENYEGLVAVTAAGRAWGSRGWHIVDRSGAEHLIGQGGVWHVQRYRPGTRVRVVASQHEAFFVTTSAASDQMNSSGIQRSIRLAVSAVRAIPELYWGSVDILLGGARTQMEHRGRTAEDPAADTTFPGREGTRGPRVEGIQVNPRFSRDERLIAGDLSGLVNWILRP